MPVAFLVFSRLFPQFIVWISYPNDAHLQLTLMWSYSAVGTSWCQRNESRLQTKISTDVKKPIVVDDGLFEFLTILYFLIFKLVETLL